MPPLGFARLLCCFALILNITSPISGQQDLNSTSASILSDALYLGEKANELTFHADCNGAVSGADLNKENCQDAVLHSIPHVTERSMREYGDRRVGTFDVNLPQRYISCKSALSGLKESTAHHEVVDGRCIVDVTLMDTSKATPYFPFGIVLAATFLQQQCVERHSPAQGGTLKALGESSDH